MAMRRLRAHKQEAADLDMTPFISLLVALVPFLLVSVVFSHITVLDLKLPNAGGSGGGDTQNEEVELVIRTDRLEVNYPRGTRVKTIVDDATTAQHDFAQLSSVLQEVKRQLRDRALEAGAVEKKSITILSEPNTPYQTIVTAMDTVRSYKTTIATSVVNGELFPEIAFGDAPEQAANGVAQ
jgi:biopolymer transport protein ExbD